MADEEMTSCGNCGTEYEDDGDVFDCRNCREEICISCEDKHIAEDCQNFQESYRTGN